MIAINFAGTNYRRIQQVGRGVAAAIVIAAVAALIMVVHVVSVRSQIAAMGKRAAEMTAAEERLRPMLAERDRVVKDLTSMSGLLESRRFSWTQLLSSLEGAFPRGVALNTIGFTQPDRTLALDGTAQSPESLRNLMVGLEQTPAFQEPYLKHQSVDKGSISFHVVAFYRENKTAAVANAK